MDDKNNRIIAAHGSTRKLAKAFGVSEASVSQALHGKRMGELARKIRHTAITQHGGYEIPGRNQHTQGQ